MKKLTVGLTILLASVVTHTFAAGGVGTSPFNVCVPNLCGGFNFGIMGFGWRPFTPHLDYALTFQGFTPDTTPPIDPFGPFDVVFNTGNNHRIDHDYDWGYRINVGYVIPCTGNDVTIAFTHWDHDDSDQVDRGPGVILPTLFADTLGGIILFPALDGVIDFVFPVDPFVDVSLFDIFAYFDGGVGIGGVPINHADAWSDFKYQAWDLELGQYVSVGCNLRMRWFVGLRWGQIEHRFNVNYTGALSNIDVSDAIVFDEGEIGFAFLSMDAAVHLRAKSEFKGIGPRIGVDASYNIGVGFGIVGEASGALLVGSENSRFREAIHRAATLTEIISEDGGITFLTDTATALFDVNEDFHHPNEPRVVPNLEGKLGVDFTYQFCNASHSKLTAQAGYMVTHYFNAVDRLSGVGLDAPEFRTRHTNDVSLEGPYISLQFKL